MLTIVMYHYVRDLQTSAYPDIKGLSIERFEGQLDYIQNHYATVCPDDVVRARTGGGNLPANACLLTFDDGLIDHYDAVLPRLVERGLTASFYPCASTASYDRVLDVHKIHFILASTDVATLRRQLAQEMADFRKRAPIPADEELVARFAKPTRYDGADVAFIKRVLQTALPRSARSAITARLFARFVAEDERSFSRGLYMSLSQLRELADAGMTIGGHGNLHERLGEMSREEQEAEIDATMRLLTLVYGGPPKDWVMCYPYGSYDENTLRLARDRGAALGLTTRVGLVSDLTRALELERLDTNDLPAHGDAPPSAWTLSARGAVAAIAWPS